MAYKNKEKYEAYLKRTKDHRKKIEVIWRETNKEFLKLYQRAYKKRNPDIAKRAH